jgi:NAD(P)-dependent dehydrogenase (short-subunit alcohol dehydrogenase family)
MHGATRWPETTFRSSSSEAYGAFTGGNRGIGLEACRQLARARMNIVLAARDTYRGQEAAQKLRDEGLDVISECLDVANSQSVKDCAQRLAEAGVEVNVLVNNASVYPTQGVFSVSERPSRWLWRSTRSERSGLVRLSYRQCCSAIMVGWSTSHPEVARSAKVWALPPTPSPRRRSMPNSQGGTGSSGGREGQRHVPGVG